MNMIMVTCPGCGHRVSTGLYTDTATFTSMPKVKSMMTCPDCGTSHTWSTDTGSLVDDSLTRPEQNSRAS